MRACGIKEEWLYEYAIEYATSIKWTHAIKKIYEECIDKKGV